MKHNFDRFNGKTAVITGSGSGIGREIAVRLAEEGCNVVISDISKHDSLQTEKMIKQNGKQCVTFYGDVGDEKYLHELFEKSINHFKSIEILVNNAGIGDTGKSFDEIDAQLWDRIYNVNVKAAFILSKLIAKQMIDGNLKGRIINIASTEGKTNRSGTIAYSSSKSALISLSQGLAFQLAPYEITVNAVCPGLIDTPIWHRSDRDLNLAEGSTVKMVADAAIESRQLKIMRIGLPEEIASTVAFLASEEACYITAQAINVCGGLEVH